MAGKENPMAKSSLDVQLLAFNMYWIISVENSKITCFQICLERAKILNVYCHKFSWFCLSCTVPLCVHLQRVISPKTLYGPLKICMR